MALDKSTIALVLAIVAVVGVIALAVVILNQPSGPPVELKDARVESVRDSTAHGEGWYNASLYVLVDGDTSVKVVYSDGTVVGSVNVNTRIHLYGCEIHHPDGLVLTADDLRITL